VPERVTWLWLDLPDGLSFRNARLILFCLFDRQPSTGCAGTVTVFILGVLYVLFGNYSNRTQNKFMFCAAALEFPGSHS
jgi:hypothetical protein